MDTGEASASAGDAGGASDPAPTSGAYDEGRRGRKRETVDEPDDPRLVGEASSSRAGLGSGAGFVGVDVTPEVEMAQSAGEHLEIDVAMAIGEIGSLDRQRDSVDKSFARPLVRLSLREAYRHHEVDIGEEDLDELAEVCVSFNAVDILEIFSPTRFTATAASFGLRPGVAIDLLELKADGEPWDLLKIEDEKALGEIQETEAPWLFTGSPPCGPF